MATTAVSTPSEISPTSSLSILDVEKLAGTTTINKEKPRRPSKGGTDAHNISSPRPTCQLGNDAELTPEAKALIKSVIEIGKEWQSKRQTATKYFEQKKLEVLRVRNEFGVKQGAKGNLLYVPQPD